MQCYKCVQARDRMYEMLDSTISRRRSGQEFQQDFLGSLVMKHSKEDGEEDENKLTDKQLKDNILTLLVAGHDTTTAALTWLIKFLGENPIVLEQLRVSIESPIVFSFTCLKIFKCSFMNAMFCRRNTDKLSSTERVEQIILGLKLITCLTRLK